MKLSKFKLLGAVFALAAIVGFASFGARDASAQFALNSVKTCQLPAAGSAAGTTFNCQLTLGPITAPDLSAGTTITITKTANASFTAATVAANGTADAINVGQNPALTCQATLNSQSATTIVITVGPNGCGLNSSIIVFETMRLDAPGGGTVAQTVTTTNNLNGNGTITLTANGGALLPLTSTAPASAVKSCVPTAPDGIPANLVGTAVRVGQSITCTVTVTFASGLTAGSTTATVTLSNATFVGAGTTGVATATFTCVNGTANANSCTFTEVFWPTVACVTPTQSISIIGATFTPAVVTATGVAITVLPKAGSGVECPGTVSALNQPIDIRITCISSTGVAAIVGDPIVAPIPGQVSGAVSNPQGPFFGGVNGPLSVAGIGILPAGITCKATPICANGLPCAVAPAKIEISSVQGVLVDATGKLSTNLRIECGDIYYVPVYPSAVSPFVNINKNTCLGVQFGLLGLGVGVVEVNARYEPATWAVADGIFEVEGKALAAFIAPAISLSMLINPQPITVGQDSTVIVRFGRAPLDCGAGAFCVNPTTGEPIRYNFGAGLNGNVLYAISDTNVAQWKSAQPSVAQPAPSAAGGFQTTANQTIIRCGFFPSQIVPATSGILPFGTPNGYGAAGTGPLLSYFGGCEDTRAILTGRAPGVTNVSATFIADLPGAYGTQFNALPAQYSPLVGLYANQSNPTAVQALEVIGAAPSGAVALARGCNNVSPTVSEAANAYAARVTPAGALVAIWEHQAATNTFRGFSPQAGAPNDLAAVTRLRPVFVCTSGPANLDQPAA